MLCLHELRQRESGSLLQAGQGKPFVISLLNTMVIYGHFMKIGR